MSLSLVREIHKNLLPVRPQIPGFELSCKFIPTRQGVSGDFFNVVKIEDSMKVGVLLSSCNTYAISSLFLSSFLKFSSQLKRHKTAKAFLDFVVQNISSSLNKKERLHLFYAVISRSSFEIDYCFTGDIVVALRSEGEGFRLLSPSAPPLGSSKKQNFKARRFVFQPKDVLLICSPGVLQRENKKGDSFGRERIIQAGNKNPSSGVLETRQNVLFACNEFAQAQPSLRDCTVMALQARDSVLRVHKS